MEGFTYECPNNKDFYSAIKAVINSQYSDKDFCELVNSGYCDFSGSTTYSKIRWDAYYAEIHFYVPIEVYTRYSGALGKYQNWLLKVCQQVMPPIAGYDIMMVTISPIISPQSKKDSIDEIKKIIDDKNCLGISDDLIEKGKKMANAYISLYVLENYIRQYIDRRLTSLLGPNYMDVVTLSQKIKKGIEGRKNQEQEKKWLPLRGDNSLYYLDFIELSDLIIANWDYFKDTIKDQNWIKVKIEEMYGIRCLVAHNDSYILDDTMQLLEVTTKQIISQLNS